MRARVLSRFLVAVAIAPLTFGQNSRLESNSAYQELVPIQKNGKWGYADKEGKVVIKPQFTRADRFSDGLALVWCCGVPLTDSFVKSFVKMGYINPRGHWVIHSRLKYYFFDDFSDGLVPFRQVHSKWGYIDKTGAVVIRPRFNWAGTFSNGVAPVLVDATCGHIDKNGNLIDQSKEIVP